MALDLTADLVIRAATIADWRLLFEWRNDVQSRAASRNQNPVDAESHLGWLNASLANPKRRLLIAELNAQPIGTVRIDLGPPCEVSWTIAPVGRGKGLGARMVSQVVHDVETPMIAVARATNVASIRIAEAAGFKIILNDGEWVTLQREPDKLRKSDE
jgi:RimJ/RimL family protein N-acetyltransferase